MDPQAPSESASRATARSVVPVLLMVVVPLAFWPGAFGPFHAAKWLAVCVLVPAGLAVCAATGTLRWPRWQWFLPWVAISVLATVFGVAPWMSVLGSPNRNAGLIALAVGIGAFVLGASVGGDAAVQRSVLRSAILTGGVVGLFAVAERFGLDIAGLGDAGEITRARSTWGSATFAGAYLVIILPIAVAHLRSRDPRWRITALGCTVAMAAGLVATGTRAAWLAAVVVAVILFPAWRATRPGAKAQAPNGRSADRGRPREHRIRLIAVGTAVLVVVVGIGMFTTADVGRSSAVGRLDLWSTTPSVILDRPLLGSGPDSQRAVLPAGIDEAFEREHGSEELHDRAHSLPLDTLVTTGVLGLVTLAALLVVLGRDAIANLRREVVPTAIAAGLAGYLVTLLFAFGDPVIDPIAWMLAGLLWVGVVPVSNTGARSTEPDGEPGRDRWTERSAGPGPAGRPVRIATACGLALVSLAALVWTGREVLAEQHLQTAVDLQAQGDLTGALDELDSAAALAPARFDLHQVKSRLVTQSLTQGPELPDTGVGGTDRVEDAFEGLDSAQRIAGTRDPEVLMDRAELLTATGEPREAVDIYDRVLELYPNSFRAHLGLGLATSQLDQLDRAEQAWRTAADLAPGDARARVNLGILYERRGDPDAALAAFEQALAIDPANGPAAAGVDRVSEPSSD